MTSLAGKKVGATGYGLMGLTWRPNPSTVDQAIAAMKAAFDSGANFFNAGEFYGTPEYNSLHILNAYFTKYPEDADKVVLCIKGATKPGALPDGSPEGIRKSIDNCLKVLDGKKSIDMFECARVDPNTPVETSIQALAECVKAGKIGAISLSEVGAATIRKAAKIHPIACVEVEMSLWATDILENGVASTCAELNIPIAAYSPLGRGFLTGQIKSPNDIPEGDFRKHLPRFQPEVFDENMKLVDEIKKLADKKGCTTGQIGIAWVKSQSGKPGMPIIIPIPGATTAERIKENMTDVSLTQADLAEIQSILDTFKPVGGRYGGFLADLSEG